MVREYDICKKSLKKEKNIAYNYKINIILLRNGDIVGGKYEVSL